MIYPPITPHRFPRTTGFTEVPPYPYARRTRAIDTDAAGRRIGAGIETSDHDGYIGDKDVLPAYDTTGGPPKYRELAYELDVMPSHNVFPINGAESADMRNPADSEPDIPEAHSPRPLSGYVGGNAATISAAPAAPAAAHVRQ
ncbi:hypothetical protein H0H87_008707 [Tephrocybe sp. NHM501043]|nr:hypothetical protein H0H87_008707 [Tephrocybe sp. NHM501043]